MVSIVSYEEKTGFADVCFNNLLAYFKLQENIIYMSCKFVDISKICH